MHSPQPEQDSQESTNSSPRTPSEMLKRGAGGIAATLVVFQSKNYTLYWVASFFYYVGLFTDMFARGYLAYDLTGSAMLLGVVIISQGFPQAAIAVLGGTLADRVPKRTLLLWAQLVLTLAGITLLYLLYTGTLEVWHLGALSVVKGLAIGLSLPGRLSFVSEVVTPEEFPRAYGLYYVALNSMRIGGPGVGGAVTALFGIEAAILIITISEALGFVVLLFVKGGNPASDSATGQPTSRPSLLRDIWGTFVFARNTPTILVLLAAEVGLVFFSFSSTQMMPVFASDVYNAGATGLGSLLAVIGVGGLIGSFTAAVFGGARRKTLLLLGDGVLLGLMLIVFAQAPFFTAALFIAVPLGIVQAVYTTLNSTLFQMSAPAGMRGRAMSLYTMGQLLQPLGVLPISAIADGLGVRVAVTIAGGLLMVHMAVTAILFPAFRRQRF